MKMLCFLICLAFITSHHQAASLIEESKIINGKQIGIWEFPHMASVEYKLVFSCITNLISPDWSVLVAHCFRSWENVKSNIRIRVGSSYIHDGGYFHYIDQYFVHPDYNNETYVNNIALTKLTKPVTLNRNMNFITFNPSNYRLKKVQSVVIAGWGIDKTNGPLSYKIKRAVVDLIDDEKCTDIYKFLMTKIPNWTLHPSQICANATKAAACKGDAGGPAIINRRLFGLLAGGHNLYDRCILTIYPTILTRLSYFHNWIQKVTGFVF